MKKIFLISFIALLITSCDKEVVNEIVGSVITEFSKFYITTNPLGYKIFIDNKNWGTTTPDTVLWLPVGNHKLSLKHDLFSDSNMVVIVQKNEVKNLSIDMMLNPRFYAKISCTSYPGQAVIYINDNPTGKTTPAVISKIYPGVTEIKLIRSGCRDDSVFMKIKGGTITEVDRILDDTTRGVDYRTINSKIPSDLLSKVVMDKYNNKWIGSIDHGLIKFDGKNWISYENLGILRSNIITDLLIDSKERLWVGTANGLSVFDGVSWKSYDDKIPSLAITALEEDISGNIWIGTNNGCVKYNNSYFIPFLTSSSKPEYTITCIAAAKNGDMWFGTSQSGILKFSNNRWITFDQMTMDLSPDISDYITAAAFDNDGRLWVFHLGNPKQGTRDALTRYDGSGWSEFNLPLLFPVKVVSFNTDNNNNVWIASDGGLIKYNPGKPIKWFNNYEYGFYVKECTSSALDNNGDVWVTTMGGGLVKLKKSAF